MPVVWIKPRTDNRSTRATTDERSYVQEFQVLTDSIDDTPLTARDAVDPVSAAAIPRMGSSHSVDARMRVSDITVETDPGQPLLYRVFVTWTTTAEEPVTPEGGATNPWDRPPDIQLGFTRRTDPQYLAFGDEDPTPLLSVEVVNSAGQPFDPPLNEDRYDQFIQITRNENLTQASASTLLRTYNGTLNLETAFGATPRQALMEVSASREFEGGVEFYKVVYRVVFRLTPSGWDRELLDQGTHRRVAGDPTVNVVITDDQNIPVDSPVPLDGSGQPLNINFTSQDLVFLTFKTRPAITWTPLGLPGQT